MTYLLPRGMIISKYYLPPSKLRWIKSQTERLITRKKKEPLGIKILKAQTRRREEGIMRTQYQRSYLTVQASRRTFSLMGEKCKLTGEQRRAVEGILMRGTVHGIPHVFEAIEKKTEIAGELRNALGAETEPFLNTFLLVATLGQSELAGQKPKITEAKFDHGFFK